LERLKYNLLPPVGPGSFSAEGSVADLLFDIPYFFLAKIIPPIDVVNELLQKGIVDAGMSGGLKWKPFELDAPSYAKLAANLRQMDFVRLVLIGKSGLSSIYRSVVTNWRKMSLSQPPGNC
jgi:hypothetical protein